MSSYGTLAVVNRSSINDDNVQQVNKTGTTLLPSPHSNDNSTLDSIKNGHIAPNYETYQGTNEEESLQLLSLQHRGNSFDEVMEKHITGAHVRGRNLVWLVATIFAIGGTLLLLKLHRIEENATRDADEPSSFGPNSKARAPFSTLDPVKDLGLYEFHRSKSSKPGPALTNVKDSTDTKPTLQKNYPTNTWYQSLLMPGGEPDVTHRAYAIPYVVDAVGPMPGLRVHPNHVDASSSVVQLYVIEEYGLTIGASVDVSHTSHKNATTDASLSRQYTVMHTTPIGLTLGWNSYSMYSSISKGMPYATMRYEGIQQVGANGETILPTVAAEVLLAKLPLADGAHQMSCASPGERAVPFVVEKEVELFFKRSDFTWLVFVSEPVLMQCVLDENEMMRLQVVDWNTEPEVERDLVVRVALSKKCTSGVNPIYCHQEKLHPTSLMLGQGHYDVQLRTHANFFSGPNTTFTFYFENDTTAVLVFDWDMQDMSEIALHPLPTNTTDLSMIGFALPHHFDTIVQHPPTDHDIYCVATLTGPACLYEGPVWEVKEPIPAIGFRATRPPAAWSIPSIAESLNFDIKYTLPDFYRRGAGDTYFSGKMLAKLARIVLIAEEVDELCRSDDETEYVEACKGVVLPSKTDISLAVSALRSSLEIWINGTAEIPFVYDSAWGGVVSCGCDFDGDKEICKNKFPHCTGFDDPGLNFGNAFYNDMHFHYGYFIFGAAVVAHFDPEWGRNTFELVLLLIRCIANPSEDDVHFPTWRHKDWYNGHSWASGIAVVFLNGKNQESSSESIAAYEAISLYGNAMVSAWTQTGSRDKARLALEIEQTGQLLTATELKSARTYWHVTNDQTIKIYPSAYTPRTIGILWQTMAQCQTWFGSAPYLAYGIQLLPITPIAEYRDTVSWTKEMYHIFAEACSADIDCTLNGWSVIQLALLSVVGHQKESADLARELPAEVFESAGGNGHSLSNTLWYVATRPVIDNPLPLSKAEISSAFAHSQPSAKGNQVTDCGRPLTCTDYVLDTIAGEYSCRQRMDWLVQQLGHTEIEACSQIGGEENPRECGACDPNAVEKNNTDNAASKCSQCTPEQCHSDLNRCPVFGATFVCTEGDSIGGCSGTPWDVPSRQCSECCELTKCSKPSPAELRAKNEDNCPPCTHHECHGLAHGCAHYNGVQYLCVAGASEGGCSLLPWDVQGEQCAKCCTILPECAR